MYHYDSLQAKCIAPELRKQLIALYSHTSDGATLQIIQPQVQVQRGSKDCGCFAVTFAVSLLLGDDPTTLTYHQKDMRQHFINCLESRLFCSFSSNRKEGKEKNSRCEIEHSAINIQSPIFKHLYIMYIMMITYMDIYLCVHTPYNTNHLHCVPNLHSLSPEVENELREETEWYQLGLPLEFHYPN